MEFLKINDVTYIYMQEKKFKTNHVSFKFSMPIDSDKCASLIVLNELMSKSCKKYPSVKTLSRKLSELYDTKVMTNLSQKGKLVVFEVNFNYISSNYLPNNIEDDVIEIMREIIFNPNLKNEEYLKSVISKRILEVESIYDDKMQYSIKRMKEILDPKQEILIDVNSTVERLKSVLSENVENMYQEMMSSSNVCITINSDNPREIIDKISSSFKFNNSRYNYEHLNVFDVLTDNQFVSETQNLKQSKLVIGAKLNIDPSDFIAFQVFNGVFGGFPSSRLFTNIREKQSLAYTVFSAFDPTLNIMFLLAGIDNGDLEKSDQEMVSEIIHSLNNELCDIKTGNVSSQELEKSKVMLLSTIKSSIDSQIGIQSINYAYYLRGEQFNFEDFSQKLASVCVDDIVRLANKVHFNVTYLLRGDK